MGLPREWASDKRVNSASIHSLCPVHACPSAMVWHCKEAITSCGPLILDSSASRIMSQIHLFVCLFVCFLETGSCSVTQAGVQWLNLSLLQPPLLRFK